MAAAIKGQTFKEYYTSSNKVVVYKIKVISQNLVMK